MKIGDFKYSPVYNGNNYQEIVDSFPFYITRDDQKFMKEENFYSILKQKGKARICRGEDRETKAIHFFTNIGILNLEVGERLEYIDIE